jgi:hypothetical protein
MPVFPRAVLFGRDTAENRDEGRASEPADLFVSTGLNRD